MRCFRRRNTAFKPQGFHYRKTWQLPPHHFSSRLCWSEVDQPWHSPWQARCCLSRSCFSQLCGRQSVNRRVEQNHARPRAGQHVQTSITVLIYYLGNGADSPRQPERLSAKNSESLESLGGNASQNDSASSETDSGPVVQRIGCLTAVSLLKSAATRVSRKGFTVRVERS